MNEREEVKLREIIYKYSSPLELQNAPIELKPSDLVGMSLQEVVESSPVPGADDLRVFHPLGVDMIVEELHKLYKAKG